ncbi:MAG: CPBP family intramembrane glutamic endopeptidase [Candidatus Magasanikbacteria bacterium]
MNITKKSFWSGSYSIVGMTFIFSFLANLPVFIFGRGYNNLLALFSIIFMAFLPIIMIRKVFQLSLEDFGFRLPKNRRTFFLSISWVLIVLAPVVIFLSRLESFQDFYSVSDLSYIKIIWRTIFLSIIYFFAEEFLFRGFLFWGLFRNLGMHSFWITSLIFSFFHLGKPPFEILVAFFTSLLFCYLSYKNKSFIPAAVTHFIMAFSVNMLIIF